ncbi:shikimate kinase [Aequorivita sp. H23M31]|uniref:Shikimate kinase n=1 Tax=Aequorivita ciconiae TaxID=2494375 RepID=A0A410G2H0_9FLAO|nr:shikimate kinase [Aequorivita sp. H23M31]QAA81456.1 shikimate kinase [Aequorivita sp. H23M31]
MKVVLIGYMGSGKSSVGKLVANLLNLPFKDLDDEIQKAVGMPISEIFSKKGEIYFRKVENETLKNILALDEQYVLATGGGTPCYGDSLSAMLNTQGVSIVYLKTPLSILTDRLISENKLRPLVAHLKTRDEMMEFVGIHLFERSHFYNQAESVIETGENSPQEVAQKVVASLF